MISVQSGVTTSAGNHSRANEAPRVAVFGTGSIGMRHIRVLRDRCGVDAIAVPIRTERIPDLRADGVSVARSLEEAANLGARLAIVATDTARHVPDLLRAFELGMDVLVEKPLAPSADGLADVARRIRHLGRHVFVGCNFRFDHGLRLLRDLMPRVGQLHSVRIECQSYLPDWRPQRDYRQSYSARAEEGGVLRDLIHEIDYAVWLFGAPQRLWARLNNTGRLAIAAEEECDLLWTTPAGTSVSIRLDYLTRTPRRGLVARGEFGELSWDAIAGTVTTALAGQKPETIEIRQERDEMMAEQERAFIAASAGNATDIATFDDGAFAVSVCDAARRASATGGVVEISRV